MKYAITMLLVCCWMVRSASAELIFITTDTTIDFRILDGPIIITDGPDGPTTVEIVDGADIRRSVIAKENSVLNLRGGVTHSGVGGGDQTTVNVFGGHIATGEDFGVGGNATANIYGGIFGDDIGAGGSAVVNLFGATFENAGNGASLVVTGDGVIRVFGSNFVIDPDPPGSNFPQLRGVLSDGSPLDVFLIALDANEGLSQIVLIPEPSAISLCLPALFLLLLRRRRRACRRSTINGRREQAPRLWACAAR